MKKYKWIKVIDLLGNKHEYENCQMSMFNGNIDILFAAPLGEVHDVYVRKNIISLSYFAEESGVK